MPSFVSPGVTVLERDLSAYVAALSTTSVGFVISSQKGPVNTPVLITAADAFIDTFGQPGVNHFGPYAVLNYLKRGNQAWVQRVARLYVNDAATIISMGDADVDGLVRKIIVGPGHDLNVNDYIRVTQTGKRTTQNAKIVAIVLDSPNYEVEVDIPFIDTYGASSSTDSSVAVSAAGAGAAPAETHAYGRKNGSTFPLVKFTAKDPGEFANFGTSQGIEIIIEDGGAYTNVDPVTGNPITSDGIPLQGLNTSQPSVDTKIDLLKLLATATVGETRGVNYDSVASAIATVDSLNGNLRITVPLSTGYAAADVIVATETPSAAYDGTFTIVSVASTSTTTSLEVSGYTGILPTAATGTITSNGTNVSDNDTVTVGAGGGSKTYTFKTTLTPTEGEVLIGATAADSLTNLRHAINHTGAGGTQYSAAAAHTQVKAFATSSLVLTVAANTGGTGGNAYGLSKSATTLTVSGANLTGGTATPVTATGFIENTTDPGHIFGTVYRCAAGVGGNAWVPQGVLAKRVSVKYKGHTEEIFDNVVGYDATSPNYWDTVIGTPSQPKSKYITAEYLGAGGEQPMDSYNRLRHPNNPRYIMGLVVQVKVEDDASAASDAYDQAPGYDGDAPTADEYIGENTGDGLTGLQAFTNVEAYDINVLVCPGVYLPAVIQEMISVVEQRNDCLAIIDPPLALSVQDVVDWHNGTGPYTGIHTAFVSNKAALYYPWVYQFDSYTNREIVLPPSCVMPGVFANNDRVGEAWYAPAGLGRGKILGAIRTERVLTKGDMDYMYGPGNGNGVNPIATYAKDGVVVWGQRTLQRHASALDRINVRRLLFVIEKTLATAVRFLTFEQNDPILWESFKSLVRPYLDSLTGSGRALEDYILICDETTNTPERRNQNTFYAKIAVVPVKTAEHIVLDIAILPSGVQVTEFVSNDTI